MVITVVGVDDVGGGDYQKFDILISELLFGLGCWIFRKKEKRLCLGGFGIWGFRGVSICVGPCCSETCKFT